MGAKLDKAQAYRAVSAVEGQALADEHGAMFCEASAKTRENVRKPFVEIVNRIVQTPGLLNAASRRRSGTVAMEASQGYGSGCSS